MASTPSRSSRRLAGKQADPPMDLEPPSKPRCAATRSVSSNRRMPLSPILPSKDNEDGKGTPMRARVASGIATAKAVIQKTVETPKKALAKASKQEPAEFEVIRGAITSMNDVFAKIHVVYIALQADLTTELQKGKHPVVGFFSVKHWNSGVNMVQILTSHLNKTGMHSKILKVYDYWRNVLRPYVGKLGLKDLDMPNELATSLAECLRMLAGFLALNGEHYHAFTVVRDLVTSVAPGDWSSLVAIIRLSLVLCDWEVAELANTLAEATLKSATLAKYERQSVEEHMELAKLYVDLQRDPARRPLIADTLADMLGKIDRRVKSVPVYERAILLQFALHVVPKATSEDLHKRADTVHCLETTFHRSESLLRTRIPDVHVGIAPVDWKKLTDSGHKFLRGCFALAEHSEVTSVYVRELISCGLVADAYNVAVQLAFVALRIGNPFRVQRCLGLLLSSRYVCNASTSAPLLTPSIATALHTFNQPVVRSGKPMCSSPKDPSSGTASGSGGSRPATPADAPGSQSLHEAFRDLCIHDDEETTRPELHTYSPHMPCRCELCTHCAASPIFHYESLYNTAVYESMSDSSVAALCDNFASIREQMMPIQLVAMNKKGSVRPRPPSSICEQFIYVVVWWLRKRGVAADEDAVTARLKQRLIETAQKVCTYSSMRTLICRLVSRQVMRAQPPLPVFNWMRSSDTGVDLPGEGDQSGDERRQSPFRAMINSMRHARDHVKGVVAAAAAAAGEKRDMDPVLGLEANVPGMAAVWEARTAQIRSATLDEAWKEYNNYKHHFYFEWRMDMCSLLARLTTCPWEAAWQWNEAGLISTRQMARVINNKVCGFDFENVKMFRNAVKAIPETMTMCQLVLDQSHTGALYLVKLHAAGEPVIVPLARKDKVDRFLRALSSVLIENEESGNGKGTNEHRAYWDMRRRIELRMEIMCKWTCREMLGPFGLLLNPTSRLDKRGEAAAARMLKNSQCPTGKLTATIVKELVSAACMPIPSMGAGPVKGESDVGESLKRTAWSDVGIAGERMRPVSWLKAHEKEWRRMAAAMCDLCGVSGTQRDYVIGMYAVCRGQDADRQAERDRAGDRQLLICTSPTLAHLPWELLDCIQCRPNVARIPSMHGLVQLITKPAERPVSLRNAFYVLDPGNELKRTTNRMMQLFGGEGSGWTGVTGAGPKDEQVRSALEHKDVFCFIGHGDGMKYVSRKAVRETPTRAMVVLMGCGSIQTIPDGRGLDGKSALWDYLLAKSPCVVGCLWMVTDGEIDKFFETFYKYLTSSEDGIARLKNLMLALDTARRCVKLRYLTGGAVVSYGIPSMGV